MSKKIQLSMMVTWEYDPEEYEYDENMTIEDKAKYDANHPDIKPIIRSEGTYSDVSWKIVE
jgi:hypothetical protein